MNFITKALTYLMINITPWLFYFFGMRDIKPPVNITREKIGHTSSSVIRNLIGNNNEFLIKFTATHKLFMRVVNWLYCNDLMWKPKNM